MQILKVDNRNFFFLTGQYLKLRFVGNNFWLKIPKSSHSGYVKIDLNVSNFVLVQTNFFSFFFILLNYVQNVNLYFSFNFFTTLPSYSHQVKEPELLYQCSSELKIINFRPYYCPEGSTCNFVQLLLSSSKFIV